MLLSAQLYKIYKTVQNVQDYIISCFFLDECFNCQTLSPILALAEAKANLKNIKIYKDYKPEIDREYTFSSKNVDIWRFSNSKMLIHGDF